MCRRVAQQVYEEAVASWQRTSDIMECHNLDSYLGGEPFCTSQCTQGACPVNVQHIIAWLDKAVPGANRAQTQHSALGGNNFSLLPLYIILQYNVHSHNFILETLFSIPQEQGLDMGLQ